MALQFTKYGIYAKIRRIAADRNLVRLVDVRRPADRDKKLQNEATIEGDNRSDDPRTSAEWMAQNWQLLNT